MRTSTARSSQRTLRIAYELVVSLLAYAIATSGCTVTRVSMVSHQPPGRQIPSTDVVVFPTFNDIKAPWRLEGMISAYTLPIMSNTAEKREALVKEMAASRGINAVIGLLPNIGARVNRTERTDGLLATVGANPQDRGTPPPRLVVCLPPINFNIERTEAMARLDDYVREYIQMFFGYMKGYYVYRCDGPGLDTERIRQGAPLGEPLGIVPDYALLCDVEGYDQRGNVLVQRTSTLRLRMTLFDVRERRPAWTGETEGGAASSMLLGAIFGGGIFGAALTAIFAADDDLHAARMALLNAMDGVPPVEGFQGGAISPIDRK